MNDSAPRNDMMYLLRLVSDREITIDMWLSAIQSLEPDCSINLLLSIC